MIEVDKVVAAEEGIDLALTRGMPAHQPPEGRGLVGRIVIHVHPRVFPAAGLDEVDDVAKCLGLRCVSHGPPRPILRRAGCIHGRYPEEILTPAVDREGITLKIEEDIAGVRLGQPLQALALDHWTKLIERRQKAARRELNLRLIPHSQQTLG